MAKEPQLYRLKLTSLKFISSVDTPAQETATVRLLKRKGADRQVEAVARVAKLSEELGLVFGWALTTKADGQDYYDLHGDNIVEEDLIKVAAEYLADGAPTDEMHDEKADGRVVFAMPLTAEVAKAFGIETDTHGLMVAIRPSPEVFAKFKSGELTGFSIGGYGTREPVKARKSAMTVTIEPSGEFKGLIESHIKALLDEQAARATADSPRSNAACSMDIKKENTMNELDEAKAKIAELESALASAKEALTARAVELAEANTKAEMGDDEKEHDSSLSPSERKRFRALDKAARKVEVEKANEGAYTCIDGTVIRKSDGPLALKLAKQADEAMKVAQAEKSARELTELTKRAGETLGKLAGPVAAHVALLKAAEAIEGEVEIEGKKLKLADLAVQTLKAANAAMGDGKAPGFDGQTGETETDGDAFQALSKGLQAFCTENKITKVWTVGLDKFKATEKGAALNRAYRESIAG